MGDEQAHPDPTLLPPPLLQARRGVPQLMRLVLQYCPHSGSSQGTR